MQLILIQAPLSCSARFPSDSAVHFFSQGLLQSCRSWDLEMGFPKPGLHCDPDRVNQGTGEEGQG